MSKEFYEWIFRTNPARWDNSNGTIHGVDSQISDFLKSYRGKPTRIIDLGCGNGRTLEYIYRPEWKLYGIDYVASAITVAKQKLGQSVTLLVGDMTTTGLESKSFDVVFSLGAFEHMKQPNFNEPRRLVKDDGVFFCLVPIVSTSKGKTVTQFCYKTGTPYWGEQFEWELTANEWKERLEEAGFSVKQYHHSSSDDAFICTPKEKQ